MKLHQVQKFDIDRANLKQFGRFVILDSGTVVGLCSVKDDLFLQWFEGNEILEIKVELIECDIFNAPALFHFQNYIGVFSSNNDYVVIYNIDDRKKPIQISISNSLPKIKFPNFHKEMSNYKYPGNTDNNVIPFLFSNSGLLPVFVADLEISAEQASAKWLNLKYWNNQTIVSLGNESFEKPKTNFAILHTLNNQDISYAFGIGNRDGGYLKPGMEFSELATVDEKGKVTETLFSLGRLYKENKKGGKECVFSSSGKYAILTPVFKSDDWKNKQKLFDLENKHLIDIELPKELSSYRIIDHNNGFFLLVDNYLNLNFNNTQNIVICKAE